MSIQPFLIGFAAGGLVVATMASVYAADPDLFLSPIFQWSLLLIYLAGMLAAAWRKPQLPRMHAARNALVAYLIISASFYMYYYLLFEVFDPSLIERQSELMIANAKAYGMGTPGSAADSPEAMFAPARLRQTIGGTFFNFAQGAIFGAAFSFLLGFGLGRKVE